MDPIKSLLALLALFSIVGPVIGQSFTIATNNKNYLKAIRPSTPTPLFYIYESTPNNNGNDDYEYRWFSFEKDTRFANGFFITFVNNDQYTNLVWDVQGASITTGAKIILYPRKDTLEGTRNQRWFRTSDGQYSPIMNKDLVVDCTGGQLKLARKSLTNLNQKFASTRYVEIEFDRRVIQDWDFILNTPLGVEEFSIPYEWDFGVTHNILNGTIISVNGPTVRPFPWVVPDHDATVTFPEIDPVGPFPVGPHLWRDEDEGNTMTLSINIDRSLSGTVSSYSIVGNIESDGKIVAHSTDYELETRNSFYETDGPLIKMYLFDWYGSPVSVGTYSLVGPL